VSPARPPPEAPESPAGLARRRTQARLLLLFAALMFSTGGAAIKSAALTSPQIAGLRALVGAVAVLLLARGARRLGSPRAWAVAVAYAGTVVLFVLANKLTTAANTIFLQSTAPVYVVLAAPVLLGERIVRRDLLFVAACAVGLSLFVLGIEPATTTAPDPATGNLLAIASGVTWAATILGLRWMGTGPGASAPVVAVVCGNVLAFAVCLPWIFPLQLHANDVLVLLYLGVFQIALPYLAVSRAIGQLSALDASLILLVEPVLSPLWAFALHGETPGPLAVCGGAILLAATAGKSAIDARAA
jgi:drug/metabolite transporter, DME family